MADPFRPGDPVGEPSPLLDSIHVLREELTIDMRSCATKDPVWIRATYHLFNSGVGKRLDLLFVTGKLHDSGKGFSIRLNDSLLSGQFSDTATLPESWMLPATTPGFAGESIPYEVYIPQPFDSYENGVKPQEQMERNYTVQFSLYLKEGTNRITVEYLADPSRIVDATIEMYNWQIAYVLAPARRWGGFDSLDVHVLLPEGWEARSSPEMEREGDRLRGSWGEIPSDAIALTLRLHLTPFERFLVRAEGWLGGASIVWVLCIPLILGVRKGRTLARQDDQAGKGAGIVIAQSIGAAGILYLLILSYWETKSAILTDQALPSYAFLFLFVLVPIILVGILLAMVGLWSGKKIFSRIYAKR